MPVEPPAQAGIELAPVEVVDGELGSALGRRPLALRHHLSGDPRLCRQEAVDLAVRLPASWMLAYRAELPVLLPKGPQRLTKPAPADVARGIADNHCRMTLYYLERLSEYRALLDRCASVAAPAMAGEGGMERLAANLFLGAPGAVVPAHFDRHHNLLLQLEGTKEITIGAFSHPLTAQREIDRLFDRGGNHLGELPTVVSKFTLGPGDGLYIPPYAFHWVTGGPDVSLALSCGIRTPRTKQAELVNECNTRLRRLGLVPRPAGRWERRDQAKAAMMDSWRRVRRSRRLRAT